MGTLKAGTKKLRGTAGKAEKVEVPFEKQKVGIVTLHSILPERLGASRGGGRSG
jgi:hypothetical protein